MVESTCIIPSFIHIVGLGQNDEGRYMVAFEVGEEDTQFMYLDEFYERMQTANGVDALLRLIYSILGEDDEKE